MIIFWIFSVLFGASAFAFAEIALQYGLVGSLIFAVFAMFVARGILSIVRRYADDADFGVNLDDVRGQKLAAGEMRKILELIEHGHLSVKAGGKRERGVLTVGPPGTGQTLPANGSGCSLHLLIAIAKDALFSGWSLRVGGPSGASQR